MTTAQVDVDEVRRAVTSVPDPELPPVTIGMLGMLHHLEVDGAAVSVELLPTYSGCPATQLIERDVLDAVGDVAGVDRVSVRFRYDPPWSAARLTDEGHERLREFGIAPPGGEVRDAVSPDGRPTLPVADAASDPRPCPYCGSTATTRDAPFGPTPCRDLRYCTTCQQPFEAFRN
ncbi:MAG: phenylacetate-CoA oxygenase subunit PaaJ, partial [Intrasporangiaceae bacterium]|nr:phenylacetate-CoA oxygenase subunit PaaJ [Intrasporangiaceae bacterium]